MHVCPVFAGQDALPQTAPGERRGIQQARGFEHGGLVVAVSQAVVILKRSYFVPVGGKGGGLRGGHVAQPDRADASGTLVPEQRLHHFIDGGHAVQIMHLIKIDIVRIQALQARGQRPVDIGGAVVIKGAAVFHAHPKLACDDHTIAHVAQCLADVALRPAQTVGIGGVKEVDAAFKGAAKRPLDLIVVHLPPAVFPGGAAARAQAGYGQVNAFQANGFHVVLLWFTACAGPWDSDS